MFLDGNGLPDRFAALTAGEALTIGETGFGTGLNFLCAWQLFRARAGAGARLHYLSTELHPLSVEDLARCAALWPELAAEAGALLARWDALPPAFHRFVLDAGRVTLTLLVGDAALTLPRARARVDAWFLDGFAPDRNPQLWSADVLAQVSRLSRPGATLATYTVAGVVRRGLHAAGFRVERVPGFGAKREMLRGVCEQPGAAAAESPWLRFPGAVSARRALVVGGGIAGTAAAASLARRGLAVTLVERREGLATGASGNAQAALHIRPSPHGTALTELVLAGVCLSMRWLAEYLPEDGRAWSRCGVLCLPRDAAEAARQQALAELGWPGGFARLLGDAEASAWAGVSLPSGGLLHERAGWVDPGALCRALAAQPGVRVRTGFEACALARHGDGGWRLHGTDGTVLTAEVVVLATGAALPWLPAVAALPLKPIRGQVTYLPASATSARLRTVLCADSYATPARDGLHCVGATFQVGEDDGTERVDDHIANLKALGELGPALAPRQGDPALSCLSGRAGVRHAAPDYLPLAGALADPEAFAGRFAALRRDARRPVAAEVPWLDGLYATLGHGSRGMVTAPLCAELIASMVAGEPLPLPAPVAAAVAPVRFLVRALARGRAGGGPQPPTGGNQGMP